MAVTPGGGGDRARNNPAKSCDTPRASHWLLKGLRDQSYKPKSKKRNQPKSSVNQNEINFSSPQAFNTVENLLYWCKGKLRFLRLFLTF